MRCNLIILGREILSIGSDEPPTPAPDLAAEWSRWKAMSDTTSGQFGFSEDRIQTVDYPEKRWEPGVYE